jgi:hypothetical protein
MHEKNSDRNQRRNKQTIIVGEFNITLLIIYLMTRKTVNKEMEDLYTINQLNLIVIFRTLHHIISHSSLAHETYSRINHILSHKRFQ